jgi:hypothetical protein
LFVQPNWQLMIELPAAVTAQYRHWSLYNSPYDAHDRGCAIDCYPAADRAPSPVAGTVVETHTVRAPPKPYAADQDHLIVIDTADAPPDAPPYETSDGSAPLARLLHVDPSVTVGETIAVGDDLGSLVRAGFFAPWVDNHIHLGFRERGANPVRAGGSLPVTVSADPIPLPWDGRGTVVERGETYAILDRPTHPAPGEQFAGVADDDGDAILDGGLPHYEGGGWLLSPEADSPAADTPVRFLGTTIGTAEGRTIDWTALTVFANDTPITGLSLFPTQEPVGVKLICPEQSFSVGDEVQVRIESGG